MNEDVLDQVRDAAAAVFAGTPVFMAYAHGSRVRGEARPDSDLDIGYYVHPSGREQLLTLKEELQLEDALCQRLPFEVDLRGLDRAPLEVRGRVLEKGVRIYCSDEVARVDLERHLLALYHDYKPKLAYFRRLRIESMADEPEDGSGG